MEHHLPYGITNTGKCVILCVMPVCRFASCLMAVPNSRTQMIWLFSGSQLQLVEFHLVVVHVSNGCLVCRNSGSVPSSVRGSDHNISSADGQCGRAIAWSASSTWAQPYHQSVYSAPDSRCQQPVSTSTGSAAAHTSAVLACVCVSNSFRYFHLDSVHHSDVVCSWEKQSSLASLESCIHVT